ncbi:MAG: hypothetical protein IPL33_02195 [Sphingobacteriales bacterium]|jgi:hypothetical protein|nr:hypothetical protein [Sphingobacteriales bacterium]MCC7223986.1 hypothetical protein [Chitinophagales bacterium]
MKLKFLFTFFFFLCLATTAQAQTYNGAIGARLGFPAGLSYKQFISRSLAIEGIVGLNGISSEQIGFTAALLLENHSEVFVENLALYYGGGGHLGSYRGDFEFGVDGILGLEFVFDGAPLAFSFDVKPAISITSNVAFIVGGAFTLRYVF